MKSIATHSFTFVNDDDELPKIVLPHSLHEITLGQTTTQKWLK